MAIYPLHYFFFIVDYGHFMFLKVRDGKDCKRFMVLKSFNFLWLNSTFFTYLFSNDSTIDIREQFGEYIIISIFAFLDYRVMKKRELVFIPSKIDM